MKETGIMKMYGIWCLFFVFFLAKLWNKFVRFSQKFQFFSKTIVSNFKKQVRMKKLDDLLVLAYFASLFQLRDFWPICFEIFHFLKY